MKILVLVDTHERTPIEDGEYFCEYHTGKALAEYLKEEDRWYFVDGGNTSSKYIIGWYEEKEINF